MLKKKNSTNKQTPPESLPKDIFYCAASHERRAVPLQFTLWDQEL